MSNSEHNIILATDSYKTSHFRFVPKGLQYVRSYLEARAGATYPYTIVFALQYIIKNYLMGIQVTEEKIQRAKLLLNDHIGAANFNEAGWRHILEAHGGRLPVRIKSVLEGTKVPISNVLLTIENTDPGCYWLVNYLETLIVNIFWYGTTVATRSHYLKNIILNALELSGDPSLIGFKLHDFGYRGVSSPETAAIGGAAHMVNFMGTDTLAGIVMLLDNYNVDGGMPGFSIPATEHYTVTSWGQEHEKDAYEHALTEFPDGFVAMVSDSYDIINACENIWGTELKDKVLARNGTLVIRPDSGDMFKIVPQILHILADKFGYKINNKGFMVLNSHVRVIQGDGITDTTVEPLYKRIMEDGFSADNLTLGSGGGLLQKMDRDTQRFAFKCCSVTIDGVERDVFKSPASDPTKNSKRGRLKLILDEVGYHTVGEAYEGEDQLVTVFKDGELLVDQKLNDIRKRAQINGH